MRLVSVFIPMNEMFYRLFFFFDLCYLNEHGLQ